MVGQTISHYRILEKLGEGGMGVVYKAEDTALQRTVALKFLPPELTRDAEAKQRFLHEARAAAALDHSNICNVHEINETVAGEVYLVMACYEGETLREKIARGPLPLAESVNLAIQAGEGLAEAHAHGIVHRDIKPANLFVTAKGQLKILDFGLAKLAGASVLTKSGSTLGTAAYLSPEQARGEAADARSDIWSLGVVLYELLAGRLPFHGEYAQAVMYGILNENPQLLTGVRTGVPPELERVVAKCLAKDPTQRYQHTEDLLVDLQGVARELNGAKDPTPRPAARMMPSTTRRRRQWLAAGAIALVAIAATLAIWRPWQAAKPPTGAGPERVPSVLALPCKVYGAPEMAFLTDAVPGTLSTLLAQVDGLDTKVPPTSFEVEKVKGDLATLAELYQVSSFIVTSITSSPEQFVLNVQLVDAATRKVRWGKQYEGPRETYNMLARRAAEEIRQVVSPAGSPVPSAGAPSEAELEFRQGMYYFQRYDSVARPADFEPALTAFTRALALDPSRAIAAGKVAQLYVIRLSLGSDTQVLQDQVDSWARRAIDIDPHCGDAWAALTWAGLLKEHVDVERVTDCALKAVAYAPRDAWAVMSLGSSMNTDALNCAANLHAVELDPFLLNAAGNAAVAQCSLGHPKDALTTLDWGLRLEPDWAWGLVVKAKALIKLGRLSEAENVLRRCEPFVKADQLHRMVLQGSRFTLAVAQRDSATSEALAREIVASALDHHADPYLVLIAGNKAAPALARMGKTDDAIRVFQKFVDVGYIPNFDWILTDPDLQSLRGDPRFTPIFSASRKGAEISARLLVQARARGELPQYLEKPLDELLQLLKEQGASP